MSKASAAWNRRNKENNYKMLFSYFLENPCVDCGETNPVTLQFDHRRDKKFIISSRIAAQKWETLLKEIKKCDVRCANCHSKKTAREGNHFWARQWPELVT